MKKHSRAITAAILAASLAACHPATAPKPAPVPPVVVTPPQDLGLAGKIQLIADALGNVLPALGVSDPRIAQGLQIVNQLSSIASQVQTGAGNLGPLVLQAAGLIQTFGPALGLLAGPYAPVVEAATALLPEILHLAGIDAARATALRSVRMTPQQAEAVLRAAARR